MLRRRFRPLPSFFILIFSSFIHGQAGTTAAMMTSGGASQTLSGQQISLGDRIACQTAIEQVYWRHRIAAAKDGSKLAFSASVPREAIQQKAEDSILKS